MDDDTRDRLALVEAKIAELEARVATLAHEFQNLATLMRMLYGK